MRAAQAAETKPSRGGRLADIARCHNRARRGHGGGEGEGFAHEKQTKAPEGATTGAATEGALAGLGAGCAVGGLIGALVGMGIPEYEAKRYEGRIKEGGILLSVHCDNSEWVGRAKDLLKKHWRRGRLGGGRGQRRFCEE